MMTFKPSLEKYLAAYDGTTKDFSDVEPLFDGLFHHDFTLVRGKRNGKVQTLTRDATRKIHSRQLALGSKAALIHYRRIGLFCFDIKIQLENHKEGHMDTICATFAVLDGKIAKAWVHEDSFSSTLNSKFKTDFYYYWGALLTTDHLPRPDDCETEYKNKDLYHWNQVTTMA